MRKKPKNIPQRFKKADKEFIDHVYEEEEISPRSSFLAFPKGISFYGKDTDEDIAFVVRTHWIAYFPEMLATVFVLLLPLILMPLSSTFPVLGSPTLYLGVMVLAFGIAFTIFTTTLLRWYYTVNIITDRRIVVMKMTSAFHHSYAQARLEKIEDITHSHVGLLGTFFDVGDVQVDTAGHEIDFTLRLLPKPRELQDIMHELLDMKKKEVI
jgi:hypothetical protein